MSEENVFVSTDSDNCKRIGKFLSDGKTAKQRCNALLAFAQYKFKRVELYGYPTKLTIDPVNFCNLRCPLCPSGTEAKGRKRSFMDFTTFKKILDECGSYLWEIDLFNWGEPFLNKEIFKMVEYAASMKIDVHISTNLNYFNQDICSGIVKSGLRKLTISLDGASQESVEKYQIGGDFRAVINNIKQLVSMKEEVGGKLPEIEWQYLVNKYNEKEINKARNMAVELKLDSIKFGAFRCDMGQELLLDNKGQYNSVEQWLPENMGLSMYDYEQKGKKFKRDSCRFLWLESVIHPDGSVSPCCAVWNESFDFGNINETTFGKIWNNEKYMAARNISKDKSDIGGDHICFICKKNKALV